MKDGIVCKKASNWARTLTVGERRPERFEPFSYRMKVLDFKAAPVAGPKKGGREIPPGQGINENTITGALKISICNNVPGPQTVRCW